MCFLWNTRFLDLLYCFGLTGCTSCSAPLPPLELYQHWEQQPATVSSQTSDGSPQSNYPVVNRRSGAPWGHRSNPRQTVGRWRVLLPASHTDTSQGKRRQHAMGSLGSWAKGSWRHLRSSSVQVRYFMGVLIAVQCIEGHPSSTRCWAYYSSVR